MSSRPGTGHPVRRLHITGAAGSGTTTLGRALAVRAEIPHFDSDDYYWLPTDPPYREARPPEERLRLLEPDLRRTEEWVLSGSNVSWGEALIPRYGQVVFLRVPTEVRLDRLRQRERLRFGEEAIADGGVMHTNHLEFLDWASRYDDGPPSMRSLASHRQWLTRLTCLVLELTGEASVEKNLNAVERRLQSA